MDCLKYKQTKALGFNINLQQMQRFINKEMSIDTKLKIGFDLV